MTVKNIIFDLGGVMLDIDYSRTFAAFHQLGGINLEKVYAQNQQDHLFDDYEIGKISSTSFRHILQARLNITVTDEAFDHAWNAMLLNLPKERLDFVKNLRKQYKVFLLSNTNDIHLQQVFNICQKQHGFNSFADYFEKEYYSHIFGKRKPHPDTFITLLNENKIAAHETVFIDDSSQHILGAQTAGLHAMHLSTEKSIFDVVAFIEGLDERR